MSGQREVAVQVEQGGAWVEPRNARFVSSEARSDPSADLDVPTVTLKSYSALLDRCQILRPSENSGAKYDSDGKRQFLSASPGQILLSVLGESRAKYATLPGMTYGFDTVKDSAGKPWGARTTVAYEPGMTLLDVLSDLTNYGFIDWHFEGRKLVVTNVESAAVRRNLDLQFTDVDEAPVRATVENLFTHIRVDGKDGKSWQRAVPGATVAHGDRVKVIANDSISTDGTALDLIGQEIKRATAPRREYTRAIAAIDVLPLVDYQLGDFVLAPDLDGVVEHMRVDELGLAWDAGDMRARITLNDRFVDAEVRAQKRLKGIVHGANDVAGDGSIPSRADRAKPAAPTGVIGKSLGYWFGAMPLSSVDVSWAAVTTDVDGVALNGVDYYDVQCGTARTRSEDVSAGFSGQEPSRLVTIRVRAVSSTGIVGDWSRSVQVVTQYPLARLDPPTRPVLASANGAVSIAWDGRVQGDGDPYVPPLHFSHVLVETRMQEPGKPFGAWVLHGQDQGTVVTGLLVGTVVEARLYALDFLGKDSLPSPVGSIVVVSEVQAALERAQEAADDAQQAKQDAVDALDKALEAEGGVQGALTAVKDLDEELTPRVTEAQERANTAISEANSASVEASLAKGKLTVNAKAPVASDGAGKPLGALWMRHVSNAFVGMWEWTALGWMPRPLDETIIPQVAIGAGTYGELDGVRLKAKSASIAKLIVGSYDNLIQDPRGFSDPVFWSGVTGSGGIIIPEGGPTGQGIMSFPSNPAHNTNYVSGTSAASVKAFAIPVIPGTRYRMAARFKTSTVSAGVAVGLTGHWFKADGTQVGSAALLVGLPSPAANVWQPISWEGDAPSDAAYFRCGVSSRTPYTGDVEFMEPEVREMTAGELIVDGSITARKIEAESVAAAVGEFVTVKASKVIGDTGVMNQAFISQLVGDSAFFTDLLASRVIVSGSGLIPWAHPRVLFNPASGSVITARSETGVRGTFYTFGPGSGTDGTKARCATLTGGLVSSTGRANMVDAEPGQVFSVRAELGISDWHGSAPAGANVRRADIEVAFYDAAQSMIAGSASATTELTGMGYGRQWTEGQFVAPAGAASMAVWLRKALWSSGSVTLMSLDVRCGVGATLIESDAITTPAIKAGAIITDHLSVGALDAFQITSPLFQSVAAATGASNGSVTSLLATQTQGRSHSGSTRHGQPSQRASLRARPSPAGQSAPALWGRLALSFSHSRSMQTGAARSGGRTNTGEPFSLSRPATSRQDLRATPVSTSKTIPAAPPWGRTVGISAK
ncbi:hypothetical protein [Leucobacter sp. G161]|uniref:hypothetical protein n=1 Tax=Leucobacter sp. G161 TaxID=663704 RepID=UPI00128F6BC7|nr:hypothetical protein [Leucobacter sp. G161]